MSLIEKALIEWYDDTERENTRSTRSKSRGIEFHFTKKILDKYIQKEHEIVEIGCATGYYGIYLHDKCKNYTGIDIVTKNIENFNEKIKNLNINNIKTLIGDGIELKDIESNSYDIVLNLGPMYHLTENERQLNFFESKRICKNNGIIIMSYINKYGAYINGILRDPEKYPNKIASEYILEKGTDDIRPNVFYYSTPEEMELYAKNLKLEILENCGVDFLFNAENINTMNDEKYNLWINFSDYLFKSKSCTGLSLHALIVCKKRNQHITND